MLANNELGTLQPVAEVAAACRERGIPVLCDAVQAVGKIPVDVRRARGRLPDRRGATSSTARSAPRPSGCAREWRSRRTSWAAARSGGGGRAPRTCRPWSASARPRPRPAEELAERRTFLAGLRDRFEAGLPRRVPGVDHPLRRLAAPAQHLAHGDPGRRGRVAAHPPRPRRLRRLDRLGLLLRDRRAEQDPAGRSGCRGTRRSPRCG